MTSYKIFVSSLIIGGVIANTIVPTYISASTWSVQQSPLHLQKAEGPPLKPKELQHTMESAGTGFLIMQLYAQMILKQPKIDLDSISSIDNNLKTSIMEHQHRAISNATQWENNIQPQILKMNEAIIAYNKVFESEYLKLIDAANQNSIATLKDGIQQLHQGIMENLTEKNTLVENLILLRDKISEDVANFKMDSSTITTILAGDDASILNLQKDIETQMAVINENNKILITGSALLLVPFYGWIAGGAMIGTATYAITSAKNIIQENNTKISEAKKKATALTVLKVYNESLIESMSQAIYDVQNISDQWRAIGAKYENLLGNLNQTDTVDFTFVKADLETDRVMWDQIKKYAERHIKIWGWGKIQGKQYYFSPYDGSIQTGFQTIEGKRYYFGKKGDGIGSLAEGEMATDWQTIEGKRYYFGKKGDGIGSLAEGEMATDWQTIEGKRYYFGKKG
ncbi:HBL/NHE enterotoxin family protein, partial [Bacillus thuringiensis]|uniref:HBL/NHE enterotoxin family protein n=1 Tax=Bacillus thuringiensis TaxID=1428 RepID=UPI003458ACDE